MKGGVRMKKLWCLTLMVMLLLVGCEKAKEEENVQKPEIEQMEVREFTFLDEKKLIEGTENLSYVPSDILENASFPNIYGLGDNLLVVSYPEYFGEDGTPEIQQLELNLVSLADGSLLATERIPTMGSEIQILQDHVAVSDGYHGTVDIFNEKLELTRHCDLGSNDMNNFCMSEDLEHLYISNWDVGIDLYEMSTAKREEALADEKNIYVTRDQNLHLYCHYTNLNTQQNEIMCIDLQTGEQELVPLDLDKGFNCARYEDYWLVQSNSDMRKYYYCTPDAQKVVYVDGIELRFKDDKIQLFDERSMRFYDLDGKYETGFSLPEDNLNYIN